MKRSLIAVILASVLLSISSCYVYRVVQSPQDPSREHTLKVTTVDERFFDLCPWEFDSTGSIVGVHASRIGPEFPWRFARKSFAPYEVKNIKQAKFDLELTILAAILGPTAALSFYIAVTRGPWQWGPRSPK